MLRRIARLVRALHPSFARPDDAWAKAKLSPEEYGVFTRMDARDREHAVRVAKKLLKLHPNANDLTVRAALLHDCGKLVRPYNVVERVWVGLRLEKPKGDGVWADQENLTAIQVREFHDFIGAHLIRRAGGHERVAEIVENHHRPGNDSDAALIHAIDELE